MVEKKIAASFPTFPVLPPPNQVYEFTYNIVNEQGIVLFTHIKRYLKILAFKEFNVMKPQETNVRLQLVNLQGMPVGVEFYGQLVRVGTEYQCRGLGKSPLSVYGVNIGRGNEEGVLRPVTLLYTPPSQLRALTLQPLSQRSPPRSIASAGGGGGAAQDEFNVAREILRLARVRDGAYLSEELGRRVKDSLRENRQNANLYFTDMELGALIRTYLYEGHTEEENKMYVLRIIDEGRRRYRKRSLKSQFRSERQQELHQLLTRNPIRVKKEESFVYVREKPQRAGAGPQTFFEPSTFSRRSPISSQSSAGRASPVLDFTTVVPREKAGGGGSGYTAMKDSFDELFGESDAAPPRLSSGIGEDEVPELNQEALLEKLRAEEENKQLIQTRVEDYIARASRVVNAVRAERDLTGEEYKNFLTWAKSSARQDALDGKPYSPPTYENFQENGWQNFLYS